MTTKKTPAKKKTPPQKKPIETIKKLSEVVNLDKNDINSDAYLDHPLIAETDLGVTVKELVKAGKFTDAAKAIEIAVRRAYQVEAAK